MKKTSAIMVTVLLMLAIVLPINVFAASGTASLSGNSTVNPGEQFTISFALNPNGELYTAQGRLDFDSSIVTLTSISKQISWSGSGNVSNRTFCFYDESTTNPITSRTTIFTATFKVASNVAEGTGITISATGVSSADADSKSVSISDATPFRTSVVAPVTAPPATNGGGATSAGGATNAGGATKATTAKVTTTKATTAISSTVAGASTTATTISKSSDASLSSIAIKLNGGYKLSPKFDPSVTKYTLTVPAGTTSLDISAIAKYFDVAKVEIKGGQNLVPGQDNIVTITVTAENGIKKTYTITVVFADEAVSAAKTTKGVKTWLTVLLCILGIIFGFFIGFMVRKIFFEEHDDHDDNNHHDFNNNSFYESHDDSEMTQEITKNPFEQSADD